MALSDTVASVQAVRNIEDNVDTQLQALENMDADDIERMRQRRLDQMKQAAAKKQARHGLSCLTIILLRPTRPRFMSGDHGQVCNQQMC